MASLSIAPLTDHTGAEVIGLDFARPIDGETRAILNRAYDSLRDVPPAAAAYASRGRSQGPTS
jgi:hypothetical protein